MTQNEFEKLYGENTNDNSEEEFDMSNLDEDTEEDLVASDNEGLEYDFSKASATTKGPERENLDGKEVVITDAKIILPKPESPWELSKSKKSEYKRCQFILYYNDSGQREYYSGITVFPREVKGKKLYSDPSINNKGKNQATELKKVYAQYASKKVEEISMREFLSFLKTKPKALIQNKEYKYDGYEGEEKIANKNMVVKFLPPN